MGAVAKKSPRILNARPGRDAGSFARLAAASCLLLLLSRGVSLAGPPFRTDDPEPVDYGHWELDFLSTGASLSGDAYGFAPALEVDYGLIPNGHLHVIVPLAFDASAGGKAQFGYGDTELGFKYRFIGQDNGAGLPEIATFPQVELPTGAQPRGLGQGYTQVFLPIWLQKSFGDWTTYGGGGYWFNQSDRFGDRNYTFLGWLLQRKITDKLTLGGEIFYQTAGSVQLPSNLPSPPNLNFNLGGSYDIDDRDHLLFSAGRGVLYNSARTNMASWYFAYQITY